MAYEGSSRQIPHMVAFDGGTLAVKWALVLNGDERAHVSQQAETHMRANFTKEKMCTRTLALYRELLDTGTDEGVFGGL